MVSARILLTLAGASVLLASVAACTAQPNVSRLSSPTPSAPAQAPANTRTYSKADIASILGAVNTQLQLGGTVETTDGPQLDPIDALGAFLNGDSLTVTPAHCVDLLQSDGSVLGQLGSEGVVASILDSSKLTIIATAVAGAPIPASRISSYTASQRALLISCKHLSIAETVDGQPNSIAVDYKPLAVRTSASQSVGFRESFTITGGGGGSSSTSTTLEAIDGNLLIFVSGVSVQDQPGLEKAVNAVVAAARG